MYCNFCGTSLPADAAYCPKCGAVTPYTIANSGVAPTDPTIASSRYGTPFDQVATDYGSSPSAVPQQNSYDSPGYTLPLDIPPPPPPPFPPPRRRPRSVLLLGIILLVLILASLEAMLLLTPKTSPTTARTSTPVPSTTNPTVSAQQVTAEVANATATVVAFEKTYATVTSGPPAFTDPLQDNSHGHAWSAGATSSGGKCQFTAGAYHVSVTPGQSPFLECLASATHYSTFAYQVQLTILKGSFVCAGLAFGSNATTGGDYYFEVCQDGSYGLYLYYPDSNGANQLLSGTSPMIRLDSNSPNLLALYLNNRYLDSLSSLNAGSGPIGVIVYGVSGPTEVVFRDAKVWTV